MRIFSGSATILLHSWEKQLRSIFWLYTNAPPISSVSEVLAVLSSSHYLANNVFIFVGHICQKEITFDFQGRGRQMLQKVIKMDPHLKLVHPHGTISSHAHRSAETSDICSRSKNGTRELDTIAQWRAAQPYSESMCCTIMYFKDWI